MRTSIYLRSIEPEDYLIINSWRNDQELQALTGGTIYSVSKEKERAWSLSKSMENSKEIYWMICLQEENTPIGYVSLNEINYIHRKAEWGIIIGVREARKKGAAFDALFQVLEYAFEQLNLNRVSGLILAEHFASIMLSKRLGFKQEGVLRDSVYKGGKYHNQLVVSILREEFSRVKEKIKQHECDVIENNQ